jgi:hypothetical protein
LQDSLAEVMAKAILGGEVDASRLVGSRRYDPNEGGADAEKE